MQIPTWKSGVKGQAELDVAFLGERTLNRTLHAAVIMYEANKRQGTHSTLTRAFVARSKKQLFSQKGSGRARVRHPQVVQCRGGGTAKGPHPRDYSWRMPKKALRVALKAALASKFRDNEVIVADSLVGAKANTKALSATLRGLNALRSCLIVDAAPTRELILSARNLAGVQVSSVADLNAYCVLSHKFMLVTTAGLEALRKAHTDV